MGKVDRVSDEGPVLEVWESALRHTGCGVGSQRGQKARLMKVVILRSTAQAAASTKFDGLSSPGPTTLRAHQPGGTAGVKENVSDIVVRNGKKEKR